MSDGAAGDVFVAGLGMVAALGPDVLTACAAARAGISRSSPVDGYQMRSAVEGATEPVIGHQAALFTRGFEGEPRLVRLAQGALADLVLQTPHVDWQAQRARFYLSLPDLERTNSGLELIADDAARQMKADEIATRSEVDEGARRQARAVRILDRAADQACWPGERVVRFVSVAGHAGGVEALKTAADDLASGRTEAAVVLGVDSLLDEDTLQWLQLCGRLKCDGNAAGLQPGEGGVAILLTPQKRLDVTDRRAVQLVALNLTSETRTFFSGSAGTGQALFEAVADGWRAHAAAVPWIISDHNGEIYRASDWGHALVRLRAEFDAFAEPVVWYPAASFGDLGAASALAHVCVAARAWAREYAPDSTALVAASSDGDARGVMVLSHRRLH